MFASGSCARLESSSGCRLAASRHGGARMSTDGWTAHEHASQRAAGSHAPADREGLARTLLDLCAQGAVLFSTWFLF